MRCLTIIALVPLASLAVVPAMGASETKSPKPAHTACAAGFTALAGTQTCLKVGGQVRTEYRWTSQKQQLRLSN